MDIFLTENSQKKVLVPNCNHFTVNNLSSSAALLGGGLCPPVCQKWSKLVAGANVTMYVCATFEVAERRRREAIT